MFGVDFFFQVVVRRAKALDHAARAEIAAADADDDERLGISLNGLCRGKDAVILFAVVVARQLDPTDEVRALSAALLQPVRRASRRGRSAA